MATSKAAPEPLDPVWARDLTEAPAATAAPTNVRRLTFGFTALLLVRLTAFFTAKSLNQPVRTES